MIFSLLLALNLSAAPAKPIVSVLYFENQTSEASFEVLRKGLADMMVTDLVAWDGVTVVERSRLEAVLGELQLQQSKAFDQSTSAKVGKLLGAEFVITGTMTTPSPDSLMVDAKVIRVAKGDVVAVARVTDQKEHIFDLEQRLVERLTEQIDVKVSKSPARRKAFVPSVAVLLSYSKGIDLADQGKLSEASQTLKAVVSKNPLVSMARDTQAAIVRRLEDSKTRSNDLADAALQALSRRLDEVLPTLTASDAATHAKRAAWLLVRSALLQRALRASCSQRLPGTHLMRPATQGEATRTLDALFANEQAIIAELVTLADRDALLLGDDEAEGWLKVARLNEDVHLQSDSEGVIDRVARLVTTGRAIDKAGGVIYPTLASLDPKYETALFTIIDARIDALRRRLDAAVPDQKSLIENQLVQVMTTRATALEELEKDEDAALAYQRILDEFPTRANSWPERRIKIIAGVEHDSNRDDREAWKKGVRACDDQSLRVGLRGASRAERMGLAGLDAIAREVEANCLGRPGYFGFWEYLYGHLGSMAAQHDDCARAKAFYVKQFLWAVGPRSFEALNERYPWCNFGFSEASWPPKVRVGEVRFVTDLNAKTHDEARRTAIAGVDELLVEELLGRGIPVEVAGTSHGGVSGLYGAYTEASKTLTLTYTPDSNQPQLVSSVVLGDRLDVGALLAPLLVVLRTGAALGPSQASPTLPMEFVTAYGEALVVKDAGAQHEAFAALAKRYPQFRLPKVRAAMAQQRQGAN